MTDRILIEGLRLKTRVGVSERERSSPQEVMIDVEMQMDLSRAGKSDDLVHTSDYSATIAAIGELVESSESKLLEHVAERVAEEILRPPEVRAVSVEVTKPRPPLARTVERVAVRIERSAL